MKKIIRGTRQSAFNFNTEQATDINIGRVVSFYLFRTAALLYSALSLFHFIAVKP